MTQAFIFQELLKNNQIRSYGKLCTDRLCLVEAMPCIEAKNLAQGVVWRCLRLCLL